MSGSQRSGRRQLLTRRGFLQAAGLGGAAAAVGVPAGDARGTETGQTMRLVFLTDIHADTGRWRARALEQAAAAINQVAPDLIIAGGDLITRGIESSAVSTAPRWQVVQGFLASLQAPVVPVLGNHDLVGVAPEDGSRPSRDPREVFCTTFGLERTYRSLDQSGCHIVLLDSVMLCGGQPPYRGEIDTEQLCWLQDDLQRIEPGTPIVVASHLPLLTAVYQAIRGATAPAPADQVVINNLHVLELLQDHEPVLVLQGHLHVNELLRWRGMTLVTGGAVCGGWWHSDWHGTAAGFGVVTLENGRFHWHYYPYPWPPRAPR